MRINIMGLIHRNKQCECSPWNWSSFGLPTLACKSMLAYLPLLKESTWIYLFRSEYADCSEAEWRTLRPHVQYTAEMSNADRILCFHLSVFLFLL